MKEKTGLKALHKHSFTMPSPALPASTTGPHRNAKGSFLFCSFSGSLVRLAQVEAQRQNTRGHSISLLHTEHLLQTLQEQPPPAQGCHRLTPPPILMDLTGGITACTGDLLYFWGLVLFLNKGSSLSAPAACLQPV